MKPCLLFLLITCNTLILSHEYLYPVGHIHKEGKKLLLMYQKSIHHVELWQWDPISQETGKALLSSYTPAGISLLPDGSGFSFIDSDTIRLAQSHKRSPALIPLYEPLYDFTMMQWFDNNHCILSAKEKEHYGIYIIDREGRCYQILHDKQVHYKYPTLIDTTLFYIETSETSHTIKQTIIDLSPLYVTKKISAEEIYLYPNERLFCSATAPQNILPCNERSIAFLTMCDTEHGFFLEHPTRIDRHDMRISFDYFSLTKVGDSWHQKQLFTFSLPMAYLMNSDERMYESILPFLPKLKYPNLYYLDCQEGMIATQLWGYNMVTEQSTQLTHATQSVLGLYVYQDLLWYGGVLQDEISPDRAIPSAWVSDQGQLCVDLPNIVTD